MSIAIDEDSENCDLGPTTTCKKNQTTTATTGPSRPPRAGVFQETYQEQVQRQHTAQLEANRERQRRLNELALANLKRKAPATAPVTRTTSEVAVPEAPVTEPRRQSRLPPDIRPFFRDSDDEEESDERAVKRHREEFRRWSQQQQQNAPLPPPPPPAAKPVEFFGQQSQTTQELSEEITPSLPILDDDNFESPRERQSGVVATQPLSASGKPQTADVDDAAYKEMEKRYQRIQDDPFGYFAMVKAVKKTAQRLKQEAVMVSRYRAQAEALFQLSNLARLLTGENFSYKTWLTAYGRGGTKRIEVELESAPPLWIDVSDEENVFIKSFMPSMRLRILVVDDEPSVSNAQEREKWPVRVRRANGEVVSNPQRLLRGDPIWMRSVFALKQSVLDRQNLPPQVIDFEMTLEEIVPLENYQLAFVAESGDELAHVDRQYSFAVFAFPPPPQQ